MTTTVHILGSGTPTPTSESFGSAFALQTRTGELVMIDCGPAATWKLAKAGLSPADVSTLFFTHHHFDHNIDYACLLLTRWDQSVDGRPLQVFGPSPTVALTEKLIGEDGVLAVDYQARIEWSASQKVFENRGGVLPRRPPVVDAIDIEPGFAHRASSWSVTSARALHAQPYLECLSYRFSTEDGDVVFTGDTAPCDAVRDLARGADVLFCMAWDTDQAMLESGESEGTCGAGGAGRLAADAGVGKLVLVHTGPRVSRPENRDQAVKEAAEHFGGEICFGDEISTVVLSPSAD